MTGPLLVTLLAPAIGLLMVAAASGVSAESIAAFHTDVEYFRRTAAGVLAGGVPYVDFELQYPPLVLVPALLPYTLTAFTGENLSAGTYYTVFALLMVAVLAGVAWTTFSLAILVSPQRVSGAALTFTLCTLPLLLILPWRYDAVPVLLGAVGCLAFLRERQLAAGATLAAAIATKLYPLVWAPVYLMVLAGRRSWRAARGFVVGGLLVAVLVLAPWASTDVSAPLRMLDEQVVRGIQVESTIGSIGLLGNALDLTAAPVAHRHDGAWEVGGPVAEMLGRLQPFAFIVLLAAVLLAGWRQMTRASGPYAAAFIAILGAVVAAFLLTNKVLSGQHVFWLLPFVAIGPRRVQVLAVFIAMLTGLIYPFIYRPLLDAHLGAVLILLIRNAALAWLLVELMRWARRPSVTAPAMAGSWPSELRPIPARPGR